MPMTLQQLINLYILQKNHHKDPSDRGNQKKFENEHARLIADSEVVSEDMMAPSRFKGQPKIPFVLLKPKAADPKSPRPLIVHTHGGPNVYMDKDKPHAEIAYFLSQGYVVACPNYRGSTGYPKQGDDPSGWLAWNVKSKDKHHIFGPQDVFAVSKYVQQMPFIDPKKIFLRGGSFGSFINSHLLVGVKNGTYENIFRGAHLSGGIKYPVATSMPDDTPLLITHSVTDDIAPFADARIFMEKMLLKELSYEIDDEKPNTIQIFVAQKGNHHLIHPALELGDESSQSYLEVARYLEHTTGFIGALNADKPYQPEDCYDQYKQVIERVTDRDVSEDVLQRVHAFKYIHPGKKAAQAEPAKPVEHYIITVTPADASSATAVAYPLSLSLTPTPPDISYYGPTLALLKLQLSGKFTGNIRTDLRNYLQNDFAPLDWSNFQQKLVNAGRTILDDDAFFDQMVLAVSREEEFLKHNPDHMVMYHTAENNSLQLYSFINLWQNRLRGKPTTQLTVIEEMRLYDFMKATFDDVEIFLRKMRIRHKPDGVFNNIPGFAERALSCNPSLISNDHSTASCSLWWYFNAKVTERVPVENVISEMLKILGIYSPERMARYIQLFEREKHSLQDSPQALLQQMFVPYKIAKKSAYMCQIWGEQFAPNDMSLHSPTVLRDLIKEPWSFEQTLRLNKDAFTNFGDCEGFGDTDIGFKYANSLQIRYLPRKDPTIVTNSYFRSDELHQDFVAKLRLLVEEDYADFLALGSTIPDFICKGAEAVKKSAYSQGRLAFFTPSSAISFQAFYKQQEQLHKGLVQNPCKEIYGGIITLDVATKTKLQVKLRESTGGKESPHKVCTYSLCLYLKGYTYYDLIKEAATEVIVKPHIGTRVEPLCRETLAFIMEMIDLFSTPSSVETVPMNGYNYNRLQKLMQFELIKHNFNPEQHSFLQPAAGEDTERHLWSTELTSAITCVLKHASLAKEKDQGHDIRGRVLALY